MAIFAFVCLILVFLLLILVASEKSEELMLINGVCVYFMMTGGGESDCMRILFVTVTDLILMCSSFRFLEFFWNLQG